MKKVKLDLKKSAELRKKAEDKIDTAKLLNSTNKKKENDNDTLIHELEVHQIELEMQNDELRKAQIKLEETKKKYFDLYDLAPVGYITMDDNGKILELNLCAANLLGENRVAVINNDLHKFIVREDRDVFYLHLAKLRKTKSKQTCELKLQKKNSTEFDCTLICMPVQNESNEITNYRAAIIDMTEQKRADTELRRSEVRYRSFVGNFHGIAFASFLNWIPIFFHGAVKEITGYTEDEFINGNPRWDQIIYPEDLKKIMTHEYQTGIESLGFYSQRVYRIITKSGEIKWVHDYIQTVYDETNEQNILQGALYDITERKLAEEVINVSRERIKMLNKIIRHDLANDLTVIKSAVNIFKRKSIPEMIDEIENRVIKSLCTIDKYKSYEKFIDDNCHLFEMELSEIIKEKATEHPKIHFQIKGEGTVLADETINSVFTNLISNSIIHGKSTQINIEISEENDTIVIKYKDNGRGIPEKIRDKIFDEGFFSGETGHTGIGLYIVKQTIEGYGGNVWVKENHNGGAAFEIHLKKAFKDN